MLHDIDISKRLDLRILQVPTSKCRLRPNQNAYAHGTYHRARAVQFHALPIGNSGDGRAFQVFWCAVLDLEYTQAVLLNVLQAAYDHALHQDPSLLWPRCYG